MAKKSLAEVGHASEFGALTRPGGEFVDAPPDLLRSLPAG
jgi:hypothetical protein